jgi:hypothetical protein
MQITSDLERERRRRARIAARHMRDVDRKRTLRRLRRWMPLPIFLALAVGVAFFGPSGIPHSPAFIGPGPYFRNCAEAHAAGYYNIPRGSPGYRLALDADGDGIACEPYSGGRSDARRRY